MLIPSKEEAQPIIDLYLAGKMSILKVAKKINIPKAQVRQILTYFNIPLRVRGGVSGEESYHWKGG